MVRWVFEGVFGTSISISSYSIKSNIKIVIQIFLENFTVCLMLKRD